MLPTGAGKTVVLGELCRRINKLYPKEKILILSHVQEIVQQDYDALVQYLPFGTVGIYSAGLGSRNIAQYTVASIQSVYKLHAFNDHRLVIVDEAHLIPHSGEGRYRTFFKNNERARIVGLTATPYRLGLGLLTDGLFDKVVYEKKIEELIDEGFLVKPISKLTSQTMNTRNVKITAGEYNLKDLSDKLDVKSITDKIVKELVNYRDERKHWLVFCIDIDHAEHATKALRDEGITCACVHSRMDGDRTEYIELYKEQAYQALVSVEMITTGFNAPNVDLIALLRPTMSPVLHVQMIGRGLRLFPGKKDCLVLDFAGNVVRLGPINNVQVPSKLKQGTGNAPTRVCPQCAEIVHISAVGCPCCGYEFPRETKLRTLASPVDIIQEHRVNVFDVVRTIYSIERTIKNPRVLKVTYVTSSYREFSDWVMLEASGYARYRASYWWKRRADVPVPTTVDEALKHVAALRQPKQIEVDETGRYPIIKSYTW